jgi:hypothetical protein
MKEKDRYQPCFWRDPSRRGNGGKATYGSRLELLADVGGGWNLGDVAGVDSLLRGDGEGGPLELLGKRLLSTFIDVDPTRKSRTEWVRMDPTETVQARGRRGLPNDIRYLKLLVAELDKAFDDSCSIVDGREGDTCWRTTKRYATSAS